MSANPLYGPQVLGFIPAGVSPGTTTIQLSGSGASAALFALGFIPRTNKTINKVSLYISAVTGTLAATDLQIAVYSDAPGLPGSSLGSSTNIGGVAPSGVGRIEWSGLSVALTAGTQYWLVGSNNNGSPNSNNATFQFATNCLPGFLNGSNQSNAWAGNILLSSSNDGSSWAAAAAAAASWRIGYSDGTYSGFPVNNIATGADLAYGSNEVGVKFTTPANALPNVAGVAFPVQRVGTPTGNLRYRLYNGTSLLGTTGGLTIKLSTGGGAWVADYFLSAGVPTSIQIPAATSIRVSFSESAADSSSNCFRTGGEIQIDNSAASLALMPFEGTLEKTTYNGSSWTDTNSSIIPFALMLNSTGEFSVAGLPFIAQSILLG